ncbi:mannose-1-phosphate guanyltransferase alpha isoform X1 [Nycticebus coucang]|uniref:mannose-1-phosphate guanyltransferase alpha isoform X1 n=2 Tax=Nycticebus coucang TaxID=9470 RepID=UPI00234D63B1|nr:mannose-1-phosphate guanyltransferase alpha isoform X1 [Nycticebus coucang]XP_053453072.1 mannose-1-phosphate guanyltransferase alpha isoform X1 [Nycticebus coucang]XP_053453073.1 mannose-1-phosphate guanyltransferase alpha isoform X1 [Nycticebus coucang]XP_053453074.1 mannose-1-phosphate guanyltransferase alpha isoform X1 [Nycticebus coucang]
MLKAVILIGGPQKGTRFRPLSFEVPKPLFPVAGVPMIQHHIEACAQVPGMQEILLIGFYQPDEPLTQFLEAAQQEFNLPVRYLQEFAPLGTGGGLYHFRDQILAGGPEAFFVLNADVCSDFPLNAMLAAHRRDRHPFLLLGTTANRTQSLNYGCIVENPQTHEVLHYVEKPSTFISDIINCGIYLFSPDALKPLRDVFQRNQQDGQLEDSPGLWPGAGTIRLEQDVFSALAGQGQIYVYLTDGIWSQIKSAGSALYASRLYLGRYEFTHPERLAKHTPGGPQIRGTHPALILNLCPLPHPFLPSEPGLLTSGPELKSQSLPLPIQIWFGVFGPRASLLLLGNVYIHPTAKVAPSAVLGPNVSIGKGVTVGEGVRLRESIVLHGATLQEHTCVLHSIVGWGSTVGRWARVEGTPNDPNPNDPRARMDSESLFKDGKLLPAITILGCRVRIPAEVLILNSIVLPHKELSRSFTNQIIL